MRLHEVRVPKWGLSIEQVMIVAWLHAEGDAVAEGDGLCEVSTDKAETQIEAPVAGTIVEISGEVGGEYDVGAVIATIEVAD
ncbi:MAG: biotin/lipoyl-containing protein [Solirubrobacteraceae bacterium]